MYCICVVQCLIREKKRRVHVVYKLNIDKNEVNNRNYIENVYFCIMITLNICSSVHLFVLLFSMLELLLNRKASHFSAISKTCTGFLHLILRFFKDLCFALLLKRTLSSCCSRYFTQPYSSKCKCF